MSWIGRLSQKRETDSLKTALSCLFHKEPTVFSQAGELATDVGREGSRRKGGCGSLLLLQGCVPSAQHTLRRVLRNRRAKLSSKESFSFLFSAQELFFC